MAQVVGRFAPTPSGAMHLGNAFSALLAWLDVRHAGGKLILRIEDLDAERCPAENAEQLMADLRWLGLDWDEGGLTDAYRQSKRSGHYQAAFDALAVRGLLYPCFCSRAERLAANAPHREDGAVVYDGRCRALSAAQIAERMAGGKKPAWRVTVPDLDVTVPDGNLGEYRENLAADCGDFIIRRADGVFAYQLAVVVDDAAMGVTHVVRGRDLLPSAARQSWLHETLGYTPPQFYHVPLLLAPDGKRLAKRDGALSLRELAQKHRPEEIIGLLAWWAGLAAEPAPVSPGELTAGFDWRNVAQHDIWAVLPENWQ